MKNIFLLLGFILPANLIVVAQDFEVAPAKINFEIEPGEIGTQKITVTNHGGTKQAFKMSLEDVTRDEAGNKKSHPAGTTERSCADWITLSPAFFELNPNESRTIDVSMQVPKGNSSTKYSMIYVKTVTEQKASDVDKQLATGVIVSPRVGIYVIQSPKSNKRFNAKIDSFKEITMASDSARKFEVKIRNTGDKPITANVHLLISNLETMKEKKLNPQKENLLPDDYKVISFELPKNQSNGKYALAAILDYGHNTALEGAQLIIEIKDTNE